MQKSTKSWRKSFKLYYALSALVVAATSAFAIYASVAPAQARQLTQGLDTQLALFLVPLTLLILAVIAEVLRSGGEPAHLSRAPSRRALRWQAGGDEA